MGLDLEDLEVQEGEGEEVPALAMGMLGELLVVVVLIGEKGEEEEGSHAPG